MQINFMRQIGSYFSPRRVAICSRHRQMDLQPSDITVLPRTTHNGIDHGDTKIPAYLQVSFLQETCNYAVFVNMPQTHASSGRAVFAAPTDYRMPPVDCGSCRFHWCWVRLIPCERGFSNPHQSADSSFYCISTLASFDASKNVPVAGCRRPIAPSNSTNSWKLSILVLSINDDHRRW